VYLQMIKYVCNDSEQCSTSATPFVPDTGGHRANPLTRAIAAEAFMSRPGSRASASALDRRTGHGRSPAIARASGLAGWPAMSSTTRRCAREGLLGVAVREFQHRQIPVPFALPLVHIAPHTPQLQSALPSCQSDAIKPTLARKRTSPIPCSTPSCWHNAGGNLPLASESRSPAPAAG